MANLGEIAEIVNASELTLEVGADNYMNVAGATKTFVATGVLRDYDISKPSEGKVTIDIFVRITGDTISIT
jgi:hypothetical protein